VSIIKSSEWYEWNTKEDKTDTAKSFRIWKISGYGREEEKLRRDEPLSLRLMLIKMMKTKPDEDADAESDETKEPVSGDVAKLGIVKCVVRRKMQVTML
jgi:hypothetical protein